MVRSHSAHYRRQSLRGFRRLQLSLLATLTTVAEGQQSRGLQVNDLMELEQIGPVAASPDGKWLAVVIVRAMTGATIYRDFPFDMDRADVWLLARKGGERRNITNGVADGSGYWNPVWSPDGQRLALLALKPGSDVHPYVWDLTTSTLRRVTERVADLQAQGEKGLGSYSMMWRDTTTLICAVLPEGGPRSYYGRGKIRSYARAPSEWSKAEKGVEATASILESGREVLQEERPEGALLAIDVVTGLTDILATGNFRQSLLSPTRHHLALFAETGRIPPRPTRKLPYEIADRYWDLWRTKLGILPLDRKADLVWVKGVVDAKITAYDAVHSWAPDGSFLAVIGKADSTDETAKALFMVASSSATAKQVDPRLDISATAWTWGGDLLVLAGPRVDAAFDSDTLRKDWWAISQRNNRVFARNLTMRMKAVPRALLTTTSRTTVLGISEGDVWSLDVRAGEVQNVTQRFTPLVQGVVWPSPAGSRARAGKDLVVQTEQGDLFRVRWMKAGTSLSQLRRPSPNATLIDFEAESQFVLFTAEERTGAFLWAGNASDSLFERMITLNPQLAEIADPRRMLVEYRGSDGDSLKGLLILPVGYEAGKRYPLIAWVYGGLVVSDTTYGLFPLFEKHLINSGNLHLLPARGYALLIPSIPLASPAHGSDPWIDVPKGVIAAVEKAIDLGIADPTRLGVMGHSYGGYSAYALVTYTHRFKAGVASAGLANLVSLYGAFSAPLRYEAYAHEDLFQAALSESGQIRMGAAPWRDLWRYLRNSPIYYVERVQTPLMIIQGDIDYVSMQQSEEMFTALYRQGKEARFVRYWGEGHVISSPANIRDMWHRIFDWFDVHLSTVTRQETKVSESP